MFVLFRYGANRQYSIETDDSSSVGETVEFELESSYLVRKKKSRWHSFVDCICCDWKESLSK